MIFYLDSSLLKEINSRPDQLYNFLEDLCTARRNGRHLIFSERETIEKLIDLPKLSPRAHRTLSTVLRKLRGKLSIFNACTTYIRIKHGTKLFSRIKKDQKSEISISIDMINGDEIFSKPRILVENRTDGDFYTAIAKLLIAQERNIQGTLLNYELVSGGGSQTPREYRSLKKTDYLVYCIVDADIDFPNAALGKNTAQPIHNMDLTSPNPTKESLILNCYSAENLIHPSMIKSAFQLNGKETWFLAIEKLFEIDLWRFLALKTKKTCSDFTGKSEKSLYWASQRVHFNIKPCTPTCKIETCFIYTPLRSSTLENISNYLNESIDKTSFAIPALQNHTGTEWNRIKDGILSWACSGGRIS